MNSGAFVGCSIEPVGRVDTPLWRPMKPAIPVCGWTGGHILRRVRAGVLAVDNPVRDQDPRFEPWSTSEPIRTWCALEQTPMAALTLRSRLQRSDPGKHTVRPTTASTGQLIQRGSPVVHSVSETRGVSFAHQNTRRSGNGRGTAKAIFSQECFRRETFDRGASARAR